MPIIFTNANGKQQRERAEAQAAVAARDALTKENEALRKQLIETKQQQQGDGTHLVVNGQVRKIGKKSHYLLDMLTLPE